MARTRGAAKKAVEESSEEVPVADHNTADDEPTLTEKPAPKPRRTRSRRGKETAEGKQEEEAQDALNGDVVTAEAEEGGEPELEAHEEANGRASRSRSRAGKGRGRKDKEKPVEAQLVSFPSIMDEAINNTGTMAPFPEPYMPKPMYTPVIPATPKRTMSNVPPKTPRFDPEVHGRDLEKDLQEINGMDTFEQLIKRSPKKRPVDSKSLDMPPPLDLGALQVTEIQLPIQTEEEMKLLCEEPVLVQEQVQTEESVSEVKAPETATAEAPKGRVTRRGVPAAPATPLTIKKTRSGPSTDTPATTTRGRRGKQPETVKTTSPPASPPKQTLKKTVSVPPPQAESKRPATSSTPSRAPLKKSSPVTPPRAERKSSQTTPTRAISKPTTSSPSRTERKNPAPTTPPRTDAKKPAPVTPLRSPVKKTTTTTSPHSSVEKSKSGSPVKSVSKPTASGSSPRTSPKQTTPSSSPRTTGKKPAATSPPRVDAKKAPLVSPARERAKKPAERPIAKPVPRKPLAAGAPKAPLREKKPALEPRPPTKEVLPIRTKRVASGPVPPTKRIRPTPGDAAKGSQNASTTTTLAPRPRIASLDKPPPPARASKPPTKPAGFRLIGEEVARKQAEAKEARKKRMEEAEAAKSLLKEKEAKARKQISSKTSSVASKSSRESNVSAAVNGQLERDIASAEAKKAEEPTKSKTSSPPRPGQSRPIKPPTIVPRPALVIQKKAPTTKLTTATSKPTVPSTARGTAGPASGTANGTAQLTPEQEEAQRKERIAQVEKARKQATERGRAAVLAWAAQQKNKQPVASSNNTSETKQAA